jgi:hypothetical protein
MPGARRNLDAGRKEATVILNLSPSPITRNRPPRLRARARVLRFPGPRIERERDGPGWLASRGSHAWLCSDRSEALRELAELQRIERRGTA